MAQDEHKWLESLKNAPVPPPAPERRAEALALAQRAFLENQFKSTQEKAGEGRLLVSARQRALAYFRETFMNRKLLMRGTALTGVLSLAVLAFFSIEFGARTSSPYATVNSVKSSAEMSGQLTDSVSNVQDTASISIVNPLEKIGALARREADKKEAQATSGAAVSHSAPPVAEMLARPAESVPMAAPVSPPMPGYVVHDYEQQKGFNGAVADGASDMSVSRSFGGGDRFATNSDQPMTDVTTAPVSTFSSDVDTASYTVARRLLRMGTLPPAESVRTEEMLNYFRYSYPAAESRDKPFAPFVSVYPTPWNAQTQLVQIGINGYQLPAAERKPVNLVFLIDVSGSMSSEDKLPLAKTALSQMVDRLSPTDTISIVTYAGSDSVVLPPTSMDEKEKIQQAIASLGAGGGTAGAAGLKTAYDLARQSFKQGGVNRVLLATDGDFNIGISDPAELTRFIASERQSGVMLSVLGFGIGNYNDTLMQQLAQNGNGVASYIDNISEANKVLGEQINGTLFTIAKDVKFQVEFNPAEVKSYRLLGYETRQLRREDFNNDKVDAGDVGAGMQVTAIYEIVPAVVAPAVPAGELRYGTRLEEGSDKIRPQSGQGNAEIANLRIRYKLPESDTSKLIERPVVASDRVDNLMNAPADARFAAAVAGFSRLLRHSSGMSGFGFADVLKLADGARTMQDSAAAPDESRAEFLELVRLAANLSGGQPSPVVPVEEGGAAFPVPGQR